MNGMYRYEDLSISG